jgi:Cellulase (glycosyl hydrolase family 5)
MRTLFLFVCAALATACGSDSSDGSTASGGKGGSGGSGATSSGGGSSGGGGTTSSGGAGGTSSGGASGSAGSGGSSGVGRPAHNTGTGFFVANGKLYDSKGAEFRVRGVNKLHWDAQSPGIPKTRANTERWVIDFKQPTSTNIGLMQESIDNQIVPMPGNWEGTCDESPDTLTSIVDEWVAQESAWKPLEPYMILNIANEWGPSGTGWRDAYITAIDRLRKAGYLCTISITSGGCGQNNDDLVSYAQAVYDSDPQKNVIFDQHIYGNWANGNGQSWQTDLGTGLDNLVALGLPVIVGEFGPGKNIGPSPTDMTPGEIIQACEERGIGWMAWAWDDPASNADDTWFALSKNGNYDSSADLTQFGQEVVENPTYGLLTLAQPATIF